MHYDQHHDLLDQVLGPLRIYSAVPVRFGLDDDLVERERRFVAEALECLEVEADQRFVDIGAGWGSLASAAAERSAEVAAVSLSHTQAATMRARSDGLRVIECHWRDLDYVDVDAIASIEMLEHVPWRQHDNFFAKCNDMLRSRGLLLLQASVLPHRDALMGRHREDFITGDVFPGATIPSVRRIKECAAKAGLSLLWQSSSSAWFEHTLSNWLANLSALELRTEQSRFFFFYFTYCKVGFRLGHLRTYQVLFRKEHA